MCPDLSRYILKTSIPPCPEAVVDPTVYMLRNEVPDMDKYVLKSSIPLAYRQQIWTDDADAAADELITDALPADSDETTVAAIDSAELTDELAERNAQRQALLQPSKCAAGSGNTSGGTSGTDTPGSVTVSSSLLTTSEFPRALAHRIIPK